tara:strand:+ start:27509 stop:28525 length:1017 start_codon:yes stop_codon:yes gene_type:complete
MQSKPSHVFISGVAGFLGSHLADRMIELGHRVSGCDNLQGGYLSNVPKKVEFYNVDLSDHEAMNPLLKGVDIVFHAAATAYDGFSVFSPHFVTQNVYSNTVSLASASINQGVKRFVYCSSMARYGEQQIPYNEDLAPRPITPYGVAKYAAELALKSLCDIHGMEYCICVPHNIIGPRQKFDDPYRNVAAIMMNRMLQGNQPIIYGDGDQKRCFSYIGDTLQTFEQLAFSPTAKNQVVNVGPDEEFVSINELARTIATVLDFELDPIYFNKRPGESRWATCSADKARKLFSYSTQYTLEDGIRKMAEWMKSVGPKPFQYNLDLEIKNQRVPKTWQENIL